MNGRWATPAKTIIQKIKMAYTDQRRTHGNFCKVVSKRLLYKNKSLKTNKKSKTQTCIGIAKAWLISSVSFQSNEKIWRASSSDWLLKKTQIKDTKTKVLKAKTRCFKVFERFIFWSPNKLFTAFSRRYISPNKAPQITKVQFAPCQIPLTTKTTIIFKI